MSQGVGRSGNAFQVFAIQALRSTIGVMIRRGVHNIAPDLSGSSFDKKKQKRLAKQRQADLFLEHYSLGFFKRRCSR